MKKKIIILSGLKCTGKSTLADRLGSLLRAKHYETEVLHEDITLLPIKFEKNYMKKIKYYLKLLSKIENSKKKIFIMDRFHLSSWSMESLKEFCELEKIMLKNDVFFFLLTTPEKHIEERLRKTLKLRGKSWHLNYDGSSVKEEAQKDIKRQRSYRKFTENTLLKVHKMNTLKENWDEYALKILKTANIME